MSKTVAEREEILADFVKAWPVSKIESLTLDQYIKVDDKSTLAYWLEFGLGRFLGSIKGGDSSKFGIYERKAEPKGSRSFIGSDERYSWKKKYGDSAVSAFSKVKECMLHTIRAAQHGDLDAVESIDFEPALKWKLAFLYQNHQQPCVLPIYQLKMLKKLASDKPYATHSDAYRDLMSRRGQKSVLQYGERLWSNVPEAEDGNILDDERDEPLASADRSGASLMRHALNQILYGPPGTGKTYETIYAALQILDPAAAAAYKQVDGDKAASPAQRLAARKELKKRFDELSAEQRVRFVTFHQSFSYEDFVEGLRAETDESSGQIRYEVVDGIFKSVCESASVKVTQQAPAPVDLTGRRVWKMSLGNTQGSDADIFDECLQGGYVLLGYGSSIDFSGCTSREDVLQRYAAAGQTIAENTDYNLTSVTTFVTRMRIGDLVVVSDGNFKFRAIGEITGDYAYKPHPDYDDSYAQMRPVRWLRRYTPSLPRTELLNSQFSQMTLYELRSPALDKKKLEALLGASSSHRAASQFYVGQVCGRDYRVVRVTDELLEISKPNGNLLPLSMSFLRELAEAVQAGKITIEDIRQKSAMSKLTNSQLEPYLVNGYPNILAPLVEQLCQAENVTQDQRDQLDARVLIIDEINRGNISRIFGELITLIEPSKRAGADEALSVTLPYSKETFSVPANVYIIGTMNTADRSLAGLDLALRRRFSFTEMPPQPELLDQVEVEGVNIGQMLRVMNQRITVLLDRDHTIGHAYFMPLQSKPTLAGLADIFRQKILPLLQEYFFEDWERIRWVLNDQTKPDSVAFIIEDKSLEVSALFQGVADKLRQSSQWVLNDQAFDQVDAYRGIAAKLGKGGE